MMARPLWQAAYQPVGSLLLTFADVPAVGTTDAISISTRPSRASATKSMAMHFVREVFASPVDQVIVVRLSADRPGQITFSARLTTPQTATSTTTKPTTRWFWLAATARVPRAQASLKFEARVRVAPRVEGRPSGKRRKSAVAGADFGTLLVAIGPQFQKSFKDVSGIPRRRANGKLAGAAANLVPRSARGTFA